MKSGVAILGVFVADMVHAAHRLPVIGETVIGSGFSVGPGGKGSNQAVAAARAGAAVSFISKIGRDAFGEMASKLYAEEGVSTCIAQMDDVPTGTAFIYLNPVNGDNAIIVYPGAAGTIDVADMEAARETIEQSAVFVTQLEQPMGAALHALGIAHAAGVTTIFNPAPAEAFPEAIYRLCDYIVPNETEAAAIVGFALETLEDAKRAGDILLSKGARAALITLGSRGVLYHTGVESVHVAAQSPGAVVDTTGAGDAFLGGFSAALARGMQPINAVRFGCATAGIAVTRKGTAPAMPRLAEIEAFLCHLKTPA